MPHAVRRNMPGAACRPRVPVAASQPVCKSFSRGRNAVRSSSFEAACRPGCTEEGLRTGLLNFHLQLYDHDYELRCALASSLEVMLKHTFLDPAAWPSHSTVGTRSDLKLSAWILCAAQLWLPEDYVLPQPGRGLAYVLKP